MRQRATNRQSLTRWLGLALGIAVLAVGWSRSAPPVDPVEELRQALKVQIRDAVKNPDELDFRKRTLTRWINALQTIGEMRRALLLQEWRDEGESDPNVVAIDRPLHGEIAKRLEAALRAVLDKGNAPSRLAAVNLIGDMGLTGKGVVTRTGVAVSLARDLVDRTKDEDGSVRAAAAVALGRIYADAALAVPALKNLLNAEGVRERRAAVEGLREYVRVASLLARGTSSTGVVATRPENVQVGADVLPVVVKGLGDADVEVRRVSMDAIRQTGFLLAEMVNEKPLTDFPPTGRQLTAEERADIIVYRNDVAKEQQELLPLSRALRAQATAMAKAVGDPDLSVRILARQAFEEMGLARLRLLRRIQSVPTLPKEAGAAAEARPQSRSRPAFLVARLQPAPAAFSTDDPLLEGLQIGLPALVAGLKDPNARARLMAMDALESLVERAAPAAPAIVQALYDPNHFVRWSASRTLGRMAPIETETAVPGLAHLLQDRDLDLDLSAAASLARFGAVARSAVPTLTHAVSTGDVELRVAAMQTITIIGNDAREALPALEGALSHKDARVRRAAAETLGRFGPLARSATDALSHVLNDDDVEVRKLAADAILALNAKAP